MKTVVLGDTHGRSFWKLIHSIEKADRYVFIGDYFDTRDSISAALQMYNFKEIVEFKDSGEAEVIVLIGNHDHHYFPDVGDSGTSGYQVMHALEISKVLEEHRDKLQMAYLMDNFLFTHAGVGEVWLDYAGWDSSPIDKFINDTWKREPRSAFTFCGPESSGDNVTESPIWIRPKSLTRSSINLKKFFIQVVGHSTVKSIDWKGKSTGGRYFFIDTLGTSGEYLIINDKEVSVGKI